VSGTRRTPLARSPGMQITPRAVDLYAAMGKLRCSCPSPKPPTQGPCPGCARWYDLHDELDDELRLPPWYWPIVGRQGARAAGSPAMNETIAATMKMFEDAIRRRRAAVSARKEREGANAEPAGQDTST
jgi:hypothetical protein